MSITTLYAELVVVGTGALLFVLLSFYAFFGAPSWTAKITAGSIQSVISLIPVLSVIYLLGIIMANVSHIFFKGREEDLRTEKLADVYKDVPDKCKYEQIRTELYTSPNTQNFVHDFEFRRSKVRICRGWCLNSLLIILAVLACFGNGRISLPETVFWCLGLGLVAAGAAISWHTATTTELDWMNSFAKQRSKPQTKQVPPPPTIDA